MAFSPYYYKNVIGLKCGLEEMEHIPCARLELLQHVTMKTTQGVGMLGACVAAPAMTMINAEPGLRMEDLKQRSFLYGKNGIMAGLVIGPLITAAFLPGKSYDSIYDRCLRIRYNQPQVRADRFSLLGIGVGLAACSFIGETLDKGAVFGYLGGFLVGCIANQIA